MEQRDALTQGDARGYIRSMAESPETHAGPANDAVRLTARVSGVVQGVGFRYWTARKADELLLTGTVRNRYDGSVELVAEGSTAHVGRFLDWLNSPRAPGRVENVESDVSPATGEFDEFRIVG